MLIEVTPIVNEDAEEIHGGWEDNVPLYADSTDEDLELILRFQRLGRAWLEEPLAKLEELSTRRRPRPRAAASAKRPPRRRRRPS